MATKRKRQLPDSKEKDELEKVESPKKKRKVEKEEVELFYSTSERYNGHLFIAIRVNKTTKQCKIGFDENWDECKHLKYSFGGKLVGIKNNKSYTIKAETGEEFIIVTNEKENYFDCVDHGSYFSEDRYFVNCRGKKMNIFNNTLNSYLMPHYCHEMDSDSDEAQDSDYEERYNEEQDRLTKKRLECGGKRMIPHHFRAIPLFQIYCDDDDYCFDICLDRDKELQRAYIPYLKMLVENLCSELFLEPKPNTEEMMKQKERKYKEQQEKIKEHYQKIADAQAKIEAKK